MNEYTFATFPGPSFFYHFKNSLIPNNISPNILYRHEAVRKQEMIINHRIFANK